MIAVLVITREFTCRVQDDDDDYNFDDDGGDDYNFLMIKWKKMTMVMMTILMMI